MLPWIKLSHLAVYPDWLSLYLFFSLYHPYCSLFVSDCQWTNIPWYHLYFVGYQLLSPIFSEYQTCCLLLQCHLLHCWPGSVTIFSTLVPAACHLKGQASVVGTCSSITKQKQHDQHHLPPMWSCCTYTLAYHLHWELAFFSMKESRHWIQHYHWPWNYPYRLWQHSRITPDPGNFSWYCHLLTIITNPLPAPPYTVQNSHRHACIHLQSMAPPPACRLPFSLFIN